MAFETTAEGEGQGRKIGIKVEDEDEPAGVIKAERSTRTKPTTAPTRAELLENPIAIRRYVTELKDTTPVAPPNLKGNASEGWRYFQLLTATLNYLVTVFKDEDNPKEQTYLFYQEWLIVNNTDYKDSPFISFSSADRLIRHLWKGNVVLRLWLLADQQIRALSGK